MKPIFAPVAAGAIAGCALYGILATASRELPPSEDPWLDAWQAEGLKAEFRLVTAEPEKNFRLVDARPLFEAPVFQGTAIRNYQLMNHPVQVVRLPRADLLSELPEGRHYDFRMRPKGTAVHLCRSARTLLVIPVQVKWLGPIPIPKASRQEIEQAFEAFEEAARKRP